MPFVEFEGRTRPVGPGVLTVGCAPEAGWRVLGRGLEPLHAILSPEGGGRARIVAASAGAVIVLNGVELPDGKGVLQFGDVVRMGTAEFRYRQLPDASAPGAYLRDTRRGRVFTLVDHTTIGRDVSSTILLDQPDVSRHHATIDREGGGYHAAAVGAAVVSLNGERLVEPALLLEGDELAVGNSVLRFTTTRPSATLGTAPVRRPPAEPRSLNAQTTFMGRIEIREEQTRVVRRKVTHGATIVISIGVAIVLVVMAFFGAHDAAIARHRRPPRAVVQIPADSIN
jgi:pSer/pThr/pTyr-binding forkhead associated (FHA) protein